MKRNIPENSRVPINIQRPDAACTLSILPQLFFEEPRKIRRCCSDVKHRHQTRDISRRVERTIRSQRCARQPEEFRADLNRKDFLRREIWRPVMSLPDDTPGLVGFEGWRNGLRYHGGSFVGFLGGRKVGESRDGVN